MQMPCFSKLSKSSLASGGKGGGPVLRGGGGGGGAGLTGFGGVANAADGGGGGAGLTGFGGVANAADGGGGGAGLTGLGGVANAAADGGGGGGAGLTGLGGVANAADGGGGGGGAGLTGLGGVANAAAGGGEADITGFVADPGLTTSANLANLVTKSPPAGPCCLFCVIHSCTYCDFGGTSGGCLDATNAGGLTLSAEGVLLAPARPRIILLPCPDAEPMIDVAARAFLEKTIGNRGEGLPSGRMAARDGLITGISFGHNE